MVLPARSPGGHTNMPVEQLTYAQIAEHLGVTPEAARAVAKRHHLPRQRANDGKTPVAIDLEEVRHKPLSGRAPRGHPAVADVVATLRARVDGLEAELVTERERSAGHRADFERERDRADQMVTTLNRMSAESAAVPALRDTAAFLKAA